VLLAILPLVGAGAETILVATQESVDGGPCAPPLPLGEGLSAALFEAGHVVFDQGASPGSAPIAALVRLARAGGAGWVLEAATDFRETRSGTGPALITAQARWTLTRADSGAQAGEGKLEATNKGREKAVDRAALGAEIGEAIACAIEALLARGG
jgi:hypothetical protein